MVTAKRGGGWELPLPELGTLSAPNITPDPVVGLGTWTDDEIARAIREGVARDGTALFPVMDYPGYAKMDDGDVESVVVYLRTIAPLKNSVPRRRLIFPLNLIVNTIPMPLAGPVGPHPADRISNTDPPADCPVCGQRHGLGNLNTVQKTP
jgi:hypothetical protein